MPTTDAPVLTLRELTVANLKCFPMAELRDLRRTTILLGPNNVGKSALLVGLRRLTRLAEECVPIRGSKDGRAVWGDLHTFQTRAGDVTDDQLSGELRFRVDISDATTLFTQEPFPVSGSPGPVPLELIVSIGSGQQIKMQEAAMADLIARFDAFLPQNNRPNTTDSCVHFGIRLATALAEQIVYVPSEREILRSLDSDDYADHEERRFAGRDSIRRLTQWHLKDDRTRLEAVQSFVSKVLDADVQIRTALDPAIEININRTSWRDLSQLGSGIGHLIVIAIATQLVDSPIVLLEEPELSLHPRLQRRLLLVLGQFSHQVLITTHSNHIIDATGPETRLFRVSHGPSNRTVVQPIGTRVLEALHDIGARPSSLAEANAVLWVEGPSDAIYLRHWLTIHGSQFTEGIDFVFAFHAGALLHHSTETRVNESLSVFTEINPNYFVVLDQDPNEDGEPVHAYTQRWNGHDRAWITEPKEIEGYISDRALRAALGKPEASSTSETSRSLRDRLMALGLPTSWSKRKVELAKSVIAVATGGSDVLHEDHRADMAVNVGRIVRFIERCRADDDSLAPPP